MLGFEYLSFYWVFGPSGGLGFSTTALRVTYRYAKDAVTVDQRDPECDDPIGVTDERV